MNTISNLSLASNKVLSSADLMRYGIGPYLDNNDKKALVQCNRQMHRFMRDQILINFDLKHSLKYIFDEGYRQIIDMRYKPNRLCFTFSYIRGDLSDTGSMITDNDEVDNHLADVDNYIRDNFPTITTLVNNTINQYGNITECVVESLFKRDTPISMRYNAHDLIKNAYSANFMFTNISDASAFGNIRVLNLAYSRVTDLSALCNVYSLNITATRALDMSALVNVRVLDARLTKIPDLSALIKAISINISCAWINKVPKQDSLFHLDMIHARIMTLEEFNQDLRTHPATIGFYQYLLNEQNMREVILNPIEIASMLGNVAIIAGY